MTTIQDLGEKVAANVERVIIGKRQEVRLTLVALLCRGHLLIEDVPGTGKTMLAKAVARSLGCSFRRIQFTPDLLPSDVTGLSIYNQKTQEFEFRPGPIMAQVVLADEINRATPKTQSALLECMEEGQISVDGATYKIPAPFHVLATQNPIEYEGTFPLPETQLDRFIMRVNIGYPSAADEVTIIGNQQFNHPIADLKPVASGSDLENLQNAVKEVFVDDSIKHYIVTLVGATRNHSAIYLGASPRGSLALFRTAQARALLQGRDYVLPDDVKALAEPVLAHRLVVRLSDTSSDKSGRTVIANLIDTIPVPGTLVR